MLLELIELRPDLSVRKPHKRRTEFFVVVTWCFVGFFVDRFQTETVPGRGSIQCGLFGLIRAGCCQNAKKVHAKTKSLSGNKTQALHNETHNDLLFKYNALSNARLLYKCQSIRAIITWCGIRDFPLRFHAKRIFGCSVRDYGLWIVRAGSYIQSNDDFNLDKRTHKY